MTRRLAALTLALVLSLMLHQPRSASAQGEPNRPVLHGDDYGIAW